MASGDKSGNFAQCLTLRRHVEPKQDVGWFQYLGKGIARRLAAALSRTPDESCAVTPVDSSMVESSNGKVHTKKVTDSV